MKSTGIVRRTDPLGRVVLPKELRETLDIEEGTPLEIFTDGDRIVLRRYEPACVFCGEASGTRNYKGKVVCCECLYNMASVLV